MKSTDQLVVLAHPVSLNWLGMGQGSPACTCAWAGLFSQKLHGLGAEQDTEKKCPRLSLTSLPGEPTLAVAKRLWWPFGKSIMEVLKKHRSITVDLLGASALKW